MNKIVYKDLNIEHICKTNLKHSYITIGKDAKVTLKTPKVSQRYLENLLLDKESWIRKQIFKIEQNPPLKVSIEDEVLLFGDIYSIDVDEAQELREFLEKLKVNSDANILRCYDKFYKLIAQKYLVPRVEYFSKIMNLDFKELKFRKMKSRWGSCSSHRVITLNSELIKVKKELIDYVIVHELAHIKHMNHSKKFHDLVENHLQDSKELRRELKKIRIF